MAGSSPRKRITDLLTSVGIEFGARLRGLALIPLLVGEVGVAGYGAYAQVISVSIITAQVATLGSEFTLVRHGSDDQTRTRYFYAAFVIALFLGSVIGSILALTASTVSRIFLQTQAYSTAFLVGGSLILIQAVARVQRNYYRSMNRIKMFNVVRGGMAYLSLAGVSLAVFLFEASVAEVVAIVAVSQLLGLLVVQVSISRTIGVNTPSIESIRDGVGYGGEVLVSNVASISLTRADRLLIGIFLGAAPLGIYNSLYRLVSGIKILMRPLRDMAFPEFTALYENDEEGKMQSFVVQGLHLLSVGMLPFVAGGFLVGNKLFSIIMVEPAEVSNLLIAILAAGILFLAVEDFIGQVYYATDRSRMMIRSTWAAALLNLGLNIILIPQFGIFAAGVTTFLSYGLLSAYLVGNLSRVVSLTLPLREVGLAILSCILMAVSVVWIPTQNIVLQVGFGAFIYFVLISLSGAFRLSHLYDPDIYLN